MSTTSPKKKYTQLKDWLSTFKKVAPSNQKIKKESRSDYYKSKGA
tara:strand:+ start:372 stop:506 length:135 start_codon:yes stop_codon:yes gene_type:complete